MAKDSLFVSGGVTDAAEARLASSGLLALTGPGALDVRTGVAFGPGSTTLVTGTSDTGPMTVQIAPHVAVTSRGSANGPYIGPTLEAATKVNIAAAPGSGSRIDVVYAKQQDSTSGVPSPDVTTAPLYAVAAGTPSTGTPTKPSIPVGALELATVQVSAGATSTNGSGVTITNTVAQTVARGARIPVRNQAERDALTQFAGLEVYRLDTGQVQLSNGSTWATTYDPAAKPYTKGQVRSLGTNANGQVSVQHGLGVTPSVIQITVATTYSTNNLTARVVQRDSSAFFVASYVNNTVNANGSIDFDWIAWS